MGIGESYYNNNQRNNNLRKAKAYGRLSAKIMDKDARKKEPNKLQKGPRIIFIDAFKKTGSYLKAKEELKSHGFNIQLFSDEILQNWIREDVKDNKNKDMDDER